MGDPIGGEVRAPAHPLRTPADLDPLLERVGEGSHGTHEYYARRDALTRRLGSGPTATGSTAACACTPAPTRTRDALDAFARRPTWMWAGDDVVDFRWGNDVPTVPGERSDAVLHLEDTTPLQPLHLERPGEHVPVAASDA